MVKPSSITCFLIQICLQMYHLCKQISLWSIRMMWEHTWLLCDYWRYPSVCVSNVEVLKPLWILMLCPQFTERGLREGYFVLLSYYCYILFSYILRVNIPYWLMRNKFLRILRGRLIKCRVHIHQYPILQPACDSMSIRGYQDQWYIVSFASMGGQSVSWIL